MPNHCNNRLTVTGSPEDLEKFVDFACPDDVEEVERTDKPLDYNKLCPMPDNPFTQLEEGEKCYLNDVVRLRMGQMTPLEEYESLKDSEDPEDKRKAEHLLHEAWYNWRVNEWRTKWNCYDGRVDLSGIKNGVVVYDFDSAWSPPTGVIRAAALKFNTLSFTLEYAEPGCDFSGVFEARGDVYDEQCEDGVLGTDYGRELYEEMIEEQERENAEDQDDCNT